MSRIVKNPHRAHQSAQSLVRKEKTECSHPEVSRHEFVGEALRGGRGNRREPAVAQVAAQTLPSRCEIVDAAEASRRGDAVRNHEHIGYEPDLLKEGLIRQSVSNQRLDPSKDADQQGELAGIGVTKKPVACRVMKTGACRCSRAR